jgi:type II secretory pathway pseudopilin PulG
MQPRGANSQGFAAGHGRAAFTLIDVLVSLGVIALLISILLPSLRKASESARRVTCQSNIRQLGIGMMSYADDYAGLIPPSKFLTSGDMKQPQQMITLRLGDEQRNMLNTDATWDGLGLLYSSQYTSTPGVFYCPSHRGQNRFADMADRWNGEDAEIISNYHYRGEGPAGIDRRTGQPISFTRLLAEIDPQQTSLIADGMRIRADFNHEVGANFFRADLSVLWFSDPGRRLLASLPTDLNDANSSTVAIAWAWYDRTTSIPTVVPDDQTNR